MVDRVQEIRDASAMSRALMPVAAIVRPFTVAT
jgi:hypothetical protein